MDADTTKSAPPPDGATQILVVEDESIIAANICRSLKDMGYKVMAHYPSGEEAVEAVRKQRPHLVLMDIMLKGEMDGVEAASIIRQYDVPVIYLTAYSDDQTLKRAKVTEPFGYLLKPFEDRELHSTIEMALYRHRAENRLRESLQRLAQAEREWQETFDAIDDLVTVHRKDMGIVRANRAFLMLAGKPLHAIYGAKCHEFFEGCLDSSGKCMLGAPDEIYDRDAMAYCHYAGRDFEVRAFPIRKDELSVEYVHVAKDITERKRAEEALKESEAKFRSLVEESIVGVYIYQEGRFKYVNPTFARIFGYDARDWPSDIDAAGKLITDEDRDSFSMHLQEVMEGRRDSMRFEYHGVRKSGSLINVEMHGTRTLFEGRPAVIGMLLDITERLVAQEVLLEKTKQMYRLQQTALHLQAVSKLKSQFLANMSHELRTPLNAIIGLSQVLRDSVFGGLNEKQSEYINGIHQSGQHLLSLINDILDLSKIEAGKETLDMAEFSLSAAMKNAVFLIKEKAYANGIDVGMQADPQAERLFGDERRIKQVLYNLLSNAVKFTERGGKVLLASEAQGAEVAIKVIDSGIGIPQDKQDLIFEPFQQLDSSLARKHGGTGLGLALTKKLVELHGGVIELASSPGHGTTVTVRIPNTTPTGQQPLSAVTSAPRSDLLESVRLDGRKALVVEDNVYNMRLVSDYLQAMGAQVVEDLEGDHVVELAELEAPDVVLLDIGLRGRDGLGILKALKQNPATGHIPVVILTAYAMQEDAKRCHEAGCDGYLTKPMDPSTMIKLVSELIQRKPIDGTR